MSGMYQRGANRPGVIQGPSSQSGLAVAESVAAPEVTCLLAREREGFKHVLAHKNLRVLE